MYRNTTHPELKKKIDKAFIECIPVTLMQTVSVGGTQKYSSVDHIDVKPAFFSYCNINGTHTIR